MADRDQTEGQLYELEELAVVPGTYFNPQTEVVLIVDDSTSIDQEIFNMEAYEGADWVRISDDVPVDEAALEESLETFQTHHHPTAPVAASSDTDLDLTDDDPDEENAELEPDPELED